MDGTAVLVSLPWHICDLITKADVYKYHFASLMKTLCTKTLQSVGSVLYFCTSQYDQSQGIVLSLPPLHCSKKPCSFNNHFDCELSCQSRFMQFYNKVHFISVLNVFVIN